MSSALQSQRFKAEDLTLQVSSLPFQKSPAGGHHCPFNCGSRIQIIFVQGHRGLWQVAARVVKTLCMLCNSDLSPFSEICDCEENLYRNDIPAWIWSSIFKLLRAPPPASGLITLSFSAKTPNHLFSHTHVAESGMLAHSRPCRDRPALRKPLTRMLISIYNHNRGETLACPACLHLSVMNHVPLQRWWVALAGTLNTVSRYRWFHLTE